MERYGGVSVSKEKLSDFTACLIYWACQNGMTLTLNDLALHTLMAVNEYASKVLKSASAGGETKPQSLSDIVRERRKNRI